MHQNFLVIAGLLILSLVSGMLGLGVDFAAIPFLGLFLADLVHQAARAGLKPGATR
jgi:ABC-type enterochelin transport system permease subunit